MGFSTNCSASHSSLIDNKAAALSVLTKSVDLVKDAHEEMEQVRGPLFFDGHWKATLCLVDEDWL